MAKTKVKTTNGTFEARGIVGGVKKPDFYKESTTESGKTYKQLNFFIQTCKDNKVYVSLKAFTPENVYFYKAAKDGASAETKQVPYKDRKKFKEEGFKIIGINCGLEKVIDKDGNTVNKIEYLCDYDAVDYIREHLQDYQYVFAKGTVEYSSYEGKHYKSNMINQISLGKMQYTESQINQLRTDGEDPQVYLVKDLIPCEQADKQTLLTAKDSIEIANFKQVIVIDEVDRTEGNSFEVSAYIIKYGKEESNVERATFVCEKEALGKNLSKLKPYTAITVSGKIMNKVVTEISDDDDDGWGTDLQTTTTYEKKYLITYADKDSIDTDTYTEEILAECKRINKEFGSTKSNTAKTASSSDEDDDDSWD